MMLIEKQRSEPGPLFETFFIKRVVCLLTVMLLTVGGLVSYLSVTKENYPDLKVPFATVKTEWPGGDPETIEKRITNKLEEKIKAVPNLKRYESASYNSYSLITVEFHADADVDESINLLRAEVEKVDDLPVQAKKPVVTKLSVNDTPILTINLYGEINAQVKNRIAESLKDSLLMIPGVRDVNINGQRKDEVFILLDNEMIKSLRISPETIRDAIVEANVDMPLDDIESDVYSPAVKLKGRFRDINDLRSLTVARVNDRPVFLREVAEVRRDLAQEKTRIRMAYRGSGRNGGIVEKEPEFREALSLDVLRVPGADTVNIIRKARSELEKFSKGPKWAAGLHYAITDDCAITILDHLKEVFVNGVEAIIIVVFVLLIALTWREALVAGFSIPVTICGVMTLLPLLGYTLNQMVIVGMVLSLGMLVDVFILVMEGMHENIYSKGMNFRDAATATVKTYTLPALTGQLTTIFAFLPLACIGGTSGKFIRIIPIIVSLTLFISFLVAMFVDIPISWFVFKGVLKNAKTVSKTKIDLLTEKAEQWYHANISALTLKNKLTASICVGICILLFFAALFTGQFLRNEMYPKSDSLTLGATIELSPNTTLEGADTVALKIAEIFKSKPYFESVVVYTGMRSPMARNSQLLVGESFYLIGFGCRFVPKDERAVKESYKYLPDLRKEIEAMLTKVAPGAKMQFHIDTGGASDKAPIELRLISNDMDQLRSLSHKMQQVLKTIPGTSDVSDNLGPAKFSISLKMDREAMDFYRITADSLGKQLRYAAGCEEIAAYPAPDNKEELKIRLGYLWPSREGKPGGPMNLEEIESIMAFKSDGKPVMMASLLDTVSSSSPLSITHFAGNRTVVVSCQTENRTPMAILDDLQQKIEEMKKNGEWPSNCEYQFGGEIEEMEETYGSAAGAVIIAIFLVFSVLSLQFGNFKQPFIIMSALPLALTGVIFGFFFFDLSFSFPGMIGVVSLIGIAVNDSIVMIETMNEHKQSGKSIKDAAKYGGGQRLRPIIVTSVTTISGLIPLMLSSPMWKPLCAAIIFGLLASTLISLIIVPCLYLLLTPENEA